MCVNLVQDAERALRSNMMNSMVSEGPPCGQPATRKVQALPTGPGMSPPDGVRSTDKPSMASATSVPGPMSDTATREPPTAPAALRAAARMGTDHISRAPVAPMYPGAQCEIIPNSRADLSVSGAQAMTQVSGGRPPSVQSKPEVAISSTTDPRLNRYRRPVQRRSRSPERPRHTEQSDRAREEIRRTSLESTDHWRKKRNEQETRRGTNANRGLHY